MITSFRRPTIVEPAVGVDRGEVAGAEPAVGVERLGVLRGVEVADAHLGTADEQLAVVDAQLDRPIACRRACARSARRPCWSMIVGASVDPYVRFTPRAERVATPRRRTRRSRPAPPLEIEAQARDPLAA